jgi:Ca2+-binding EF-hand superfamily protein
MNDSDLRARNTDMIFAVLDTNADGFIAADDLTAIGARVCEQLHITGSPAAAAILEAYESWWEQLRADADADGDGRISRAEFGSAMLDGGGDPQAYFSQGLSKVLVLEADALDSDGDGYISQAEYQALFSAAPDLDPQIVLAGFARLDTDGDGRISREEFLTGIEQIILSSDPSDPGTSILGLA